MLAENAAFLRPRGIGELFDQAIRLYRNNFLKFIGIIALMQIPIQILQLIINYLSYNNIMQSTQGSSSEAIQRILNQSGTSSLGGLFITILTFILVNGFAEAALARAVADGFLGEQTSIGQAYRKTGGAWQSILGAALLLGLLTIPLLIWTIIPLIGWFTGPGIFFFEVTVIVQLIAPIVVIERRSASGALRRAWDLSRKRFWWILGYILLLSLFSLLVVNGPVAIIAIVFQERAMAGQNPAALFTTQTILQTLSTLITGLIYTPLQMVCVTMAYFDLRVRLEGFDLALMANQSSEQPRTAVEVAGQAPSAGNGPLVTWREMGYFVGVTMIGLALYGLLVGSILLFTGFVSRAF